MTTPDTHVALVDDDASIRRSVTRMLELSGLRVTAFDSGENLLRADAAAPFDCLVLDIHLSGISGPDLYRTLLERGDAPPVVFVTAHEVAETEAIVGPLGAVACLRKPFRAAELLAAIAVAASTHGDRS